MVPCLSCDQKCTIYSCSETLINSDTEPYNDSVLVSENMSTLSTLLFFFFKNNQVYITPFIKVPKKNEFANSIDPDEAAHNELPHLELHCLPSCLRILNMIQVGQNGF